MNNIAIHDADMRTGFPNYAIMKISAWHKARGDCVEWWTPIVEYDRVYSSKVFTFTPNSVYLPHGTIKGGTGYGMMDKLPQEIDDMFPDYTIYPQCGYAIGFLTRGCIRRCPWCVVPRKEGGISEYRRWEDVKRPGKRDIVFMDNNVLASAWGIRQMERMIGEDVRIDFNQGLDARLIDDDVAHILARLKWMRFIRVSADTDAMLPVVLSAAKKLGRYGVKMYRIFCYLLVTDIESAERRAVALRAAGIEVFAQPYRDFETQGEPAHELREFARWVNRKEIFNSVEHFAQYKRAIQTRH